MKVIIISASFWLICGCASNKVLSNIESIGFGSGGGFTGAVNQYELSKSGDLSTLSDSDMVKLKTIQKSDIKEILQMAETVEAKEINVPENVYKFITIEYNTSVQKKWVWGLGYQELPVEIDKLYKRLTELTK